MLSINFIKKNIELVKKAIKEKNSNINLDEFLELDIKRIKIQTEVENFRAKKNELSKSIKDKPTEEQIKEGKKIKEELLDLEENLIKIEKEFNEILFSIPNVTDPTMPVGKDGEDNVEIKKWGEKTKFDFEVKSHIDLGVSLDIIDIEKAAEVSGSRFFYLKNEAVLLQFAIVQFVFDTLRNEEVLKAIIKEVGVDVSTKPFIPILPPVMIRNEVQKSIHRVFGDQTYSLNNEELNLVASAEHTMAPYHMGEIVDYKNLPLRYIGYSTSFRREAGTYGKDMGGILRTHQFDKLEMESFTDVETGLDEQKFIVGIQEYLIQQLEIPYRLVHVCTGDTGNPDYNQFDIECWIPSQNKYRETHTSDYMTDYQTRGIQSFYKDKEGKNKLLHTNDATAFAIGRILIAILENYQQEDGSVKIPKILQKYVGSELIKIKNK
ncbi:MAG: serine--tRNA ligase [Patescibacteria group bacterium]